MPFCPLCGIPIAAGRTFCEQHTKTALDIKPFAIRVCTCGRLFAHNHWFEPSNMDESVMKTIKEHIKQRVELTSLTLQFPEQKKQKGSGSVVVHYQGEEEKITFEIRTEQCTKCARLGTHYYSAKLQLRNPPQESIGFIEEYMRPLSEKGMAINKVEDSPHGPDLYLTHKSTARQLGEKLVRKYGGMMKLSEQLFSRNNQTSKDIYRLNVVVDFPKFTVGDVVILKKSPVIITGLGKSCTGRNLIHDKKVVFTAGEEEGKLLKQTATVAITEPRVEVIDPETYQQEPVNNPVPHLHIGQSIMVVRYEKHVFMV